MAGIRYYATLWRSVVAFTLVLSCSIGLANAGPGEDFAAGMISYKRADFASAMPLLRKAADAGHPEAQAVLASILDAADSDEEAAAYYRKAADAGNLDGVFGLGTMLATGDGVKQDVAEARVLITRAAEGGHREAIKELALAYIQGSLGIPQDQRKGKDALKWISLAADTDFLVALEELERAYRVGDYGLASDLKRADLLKQKIMKLKGVKDRKSRRRGEKE